METKEEQVVQDLIKIFNSAQLKQKEILDIMIRFMYHLGQTLEGGGPYTSEEILLKYAENPTLGAAFMAQSLWMNDTWKKDVKEEKDL